MKVDEKTVQGFIVRYYADNHADLLITKRIRERLAPVVLNGIDKVSEGYSFKDLVPDIESFLEKDNVLRFVRERQPEISEVPDDVMKNISEYFNREALDGYSVVSVFRKSNHPEDEFLYSVIARKESGEYACWTSWNSNTNSMNHGHTNLGSEQEALNILREHFNDITDETDKYGIEKSRRDAGTEAVQLNNGIDNQQRSELQTGKIIAYRHRNR